MMKKSWLLLVVLCCPAGREVFAEKGYERTVERYQVPNVTLLSQDRKQVKLEDYLASDRPIVLGFLFTTCTTICPVQGAMFANMQKTLGPNAERVRFVSISIDPEHDTPERMREFLQRYQGREGWDFLTGTKADIELVARAFNAYVPNKMSHLPLTFLKAAGGIDWVRLRPYPASAELLQEIRLLMEE
jgi:protein SCO1/2